MFCRKATRFRFRFYRRSGHELFFMAAAAGVWLLGGALLVTRLSSLAPDIAPPEFYIRAATVWLTKTVTAKWNWFAPDISYLGTCTIAFLAGWPAGLIYAACDPISEDRSCVETGTRDNRYVFRNGDVSHLSGTPWP